MPPRTRRSPAQPTADSAPSKSTRQKPARAESTDSQTDPAVIDFLRDLDHPLKQEIETVRGIILGVSPEVREGIRWNAPSFRTTDFFATFHLRARDGIQLILHTGAKVKDTAKTGMQIEDPEGLLKWLAKDRCMVTLGDAASIESKRSALEAILRQWITYLR